jgi:hypothetical protein
VKNLGGRNRGMKMRGKRERMDKERWVRKEGGGEARMEE